MKTLLLSLLITGAIAGMAMAHQEAQDIACPAVIVDNYETRCIDGYQWLVKYERIGCMTYAVPVAQKFEIYPKANGKPKMSLPVQCEE